MFFENRILLREDNRKNSMANKPAIELWKAMVIIVYAACLDIRALKLKPRCLTQASRWILTTAKLARPILTIELLESYSSIA